MIRRVKWRRGGSHADVCVCVLVCSVVRGCAHVPAWAVLECDYVMGVLVCVCVHDRSGMKLRDRNRKHGMRWGDGTVDTVWGLGDGTTDTVCDLGDGAVDTVLSMSA